MKKDNDNNIQTYGREQQNLRTDLISDYLI